MAENRDLDALLLQDDDLNLSSDEHEKKKTRASSVPTSRIIKGTAITSKSAKSVKRKASSCKAVALDKPAKSSKLDKPHSYSKEEISSLRTEFGIDTMVENISALTNMFQTFTNSQKKVASKPSNDSAELNASSVGQPSNPILSLDPNLDQEVVDDFDMSYFSPPDNATEGSPAPQSNGPSFDPAVGFQEAFPAPDEHVVPPVQPAQPQVNVDTSSNVQESGNDWVIPQLQAEEKCSAKITPGLAKAVNAALTVKANADNLKVFEDKYFRPENCENLVVPKVNKDIWSKLPRSAHMIDSKMQDVQRYFVKGIIPLVELAEQAGKATQPIDPTQLKDTLCSSLCLLGHGFLGFSHRRRSLLRQYFTDKFKPICNGDVPVDSELFSSDGMKRMKELGDYTKIPMCYTRGHRSGSNRTGGHGFGRPNFGNQALNFESPAQRQGVPHNRYQNGVRGRGRGHLARGNQRGFRRNFQTRY